MNFKDFLEWINITSFIILISPILYWQKPVKGQIIPDQTLGQESTRIRSIDQLKKQIEGGAIRGSNLFHSLQEFNIQKNHSVYFTNPTGIENILTRITGNNASNILGKLGVEGAANLFLINPNGIFFGPNASLDIRGSFLATTGDEIRLGENGLFSATNPQNSNLLSVAPSALFFNQLETQTGNIINQSTAGENGLQVARGETIGLVGNHVIIDGGKLTAEQGRIEIGSVGNQSLIKLENQENNYVLNYAEVENFNNIEVKNNAVLNVSGEGSGEIQIQGKQIVIQERARIIAETLAAEAGGKISLSATESIEVNDSRIESNVRPGATGNGASITTNSPGLTLTSGGVINTFTSGAGASGELTVNAEEIVVIGASPEGLLSGLYTELFARATGTGGDLTINTQKLKLLSGGQIGANVFGEGEGGNLTVNAKEIEASGAIPAGSTLPQLQLLLQALNGQFPSGILAIVIPEATGSIGKLTINSDRILLKNGAQIGTGTFGVGDGGELTIKAAEIEVVGTSADGLLPTSFFTSVLFGATGNGGNINIETQSLTLEDGGQVRAGTSGVGNSGDVIVKAKEINLQGRSGNLPFPGSIQASVEDLSGLFPNALGRGDGGQVLIETEQLTILDGAEVSVITEGEGKAGNLTINATDNITLSGVSELSGNSSAIAAGSESGARQIGGNLNITTPTLNLSNGAVVTAKSRSNFDGGNISLNVDNLNLASGAQILTSSFNEGNAGTIDINADSGITLSGTDVNFNDRVANFGEENIDTDGAATGITSRSRGNGNAGSVTINTPNLRVEDMALITVDSSGSGVAGSLNINAPLIALNNGTLSAETAAGDQGNITIRASEINLQNQSQITTNARNDATGGDINIDTKFLIGSDNSNISANAIEGQGGNITITAEGVFLDNSSEITAASALGIDGSVELNTQVDPTQGVVRLSARVIDAESLVAQNLCAATSEEKEGSSFVITGKGGLPPDPTQPLTVLRGTVGWESNTQEETKVIASKYKQPVVVYRRLETQNVPQITQAMGWAMTESGKVTLTSTANRINSASPQLIHPSCYIFTTKSS
ncbi:MAG: filamentous hemagglutinin N-terminal domain-containing protein [Cyanobacteria bacterium P01_H01_bin.35]